MRCPAKLAASAAGLAGLAVVATFATVLATSTTATDDSDVPAPTVTARPGAQAVRTGDDRVARLSGELAVALGCDRDRMRSAIDDTRREVGDGRGRPEASDLLATKLSTRAERVRAAREFVRAVHRGQSRGQLRERLDDDVVQGRLDDADRDRMLTSYDDGLVRPHGHGD